VDGCSFPAIGSKEDSSFLKKKKQKDFCLFACVAQFQRFGIAPRRQIDKSFLLLFFKKEVLSFY
jgi:hypothetical protein